MPSPPGPVYRASRGYGGRSCRKCRRDKDFARPISDQGQLIGWTEHRTASRTYAGAALIRTNYRNKCPDMHFVAPGSPAVTCRMPFPNVDRDR
jgi:hypothetical protein